MTARAAYSRDFSRAACSTSAARGFRRASAAPPPLPAALAPEEDDPADADETAAGAGATSKSAAPPPKTVPTKSAPSVPIMTMSVRSRSSSPYGTNAYATVLGPSRRARKEPSAAGASSSASIGARAVRKGSAPAPDVGKQHEVVEQQARAQAHKGIVMRYRRNRLPATRTRTPHAIPPARPR